MALPQLTGHGMMAESDAGLAVSVSAVIKNGEVYADDLANVYAKSSAYSCMAFGHGLSKTQRTTKHTKGNHFSTAYGKRA